MLEVLGIGADSTLGIIGTLTAFNIIVVEVLKNVLPKKIPTKIVAMISAVVIVLGYVCIFNTITLKTVALGILGSFVVAFISMYGFDSFKDVFERLKLKDNGGEK